MESAYFDLAIDHNQGGRCAGRCRDGQYTRILVVHEGYIEVYDSEQQRLYRHWERLPDGFAPTSINGDPSGFDDGTGRKLLVIVGGFDANTNDSRALGIRTELVVKDVTERYA